MEPSKNARTIESYELIAEDYAAETADNRVMADALARLAEAVPGGHVLEIGSGPGWDADVLEDAGLTVRRTDATQAFIDFQAQRGKEVDRLDAITDDFGGPYDAVVALAVLQHLPPSDLPSVLAKIAAALTPGGQLLVAVPLGEGVEWEVGASGNRYYVALRSEAEFLAELAQAGLVPDWSELNPATNRWLTVLARFRPAS